MRIHPRPEGSDAECRSSGWAARARGNGALQRPRPDVPGAGARIRPVRQVSRPALLLWDLKLKVGQSVRTPDQLMPRRGSDITNRTALLEARWIWGDEQLFEAAMPVPSRSRASTARELCRRQTRRTRRAPRRMGDSRYVVEPNVKDGKGGLRDLHTLYWIGQYVFGVERPAELVDKGPVQRSRVPPLRTRRALLLVGPLPPASDRRPRRGAAGLRPAAPDRRGDALRRSARANRRSSASCNSIS